MLKEWLLSAPADVCECPVPIRIRFFRHGEPVWESELTDHSDPVADYERFAELGATMIMHDCPACHAVFFWQAS